MGKNNGIAVYRANDDAVIILAQAGEYIREHAADLLGNVIGEDISTHWIRVNIVMEPISPVRITVTKENYLRTVIPFADED